MRNILSPILIPESLSLSEDASEMGGSEGTLPSLVNAGLSQPESPDVLEPRSSCSWFEPGVLEPELDAESSSSSMWAGMA